MFRSRIKDLIFPPVDADVGTSGPQAESSKVKTDGDSDSDKSDSDTDSEAEDLEAAQPKKKFRKEKIGFRDRKVCNMQSP